MHLFVIMLKIDYLSFLDDDFVLNLTNNILKIQKNQKIILHNSKYCVLENNEIKDLENCNFIKKILNSIYLYQQTLIDPMIIFKLKQEGTLNDNNFDSVLYNTISVSILATENKKLKQYDERNGKRKRLF